MILNKNKLQLTFLSVIVILSISFSTSIIYSSLSKINRTESITLNYDYSLDEESSDFKEDTNEDCLDPFFLNNQRIKFSKNSQKISKPQPFFLIPNIFYDIQLLPPEVQMS